MNKRLLYVGCGNHRMKGFIHADINITKAWKDPNNKLDQPDIICDITENIPVANETIDLIYSRETLEHLTWKQLINHFLECNRILKPNGVVRMSLPSFDNMINAYLEKNENLKEVIKNSEVSHLNGPIENHTDLFIERILYEDHFYLHNIDTMSRALKKCGFDKIKQSTPGDTAIIEAKEEILKAEKNETQISFQVEAVKVSDKNLIKRFNKEYPKNLIRYFLAKYLNIDIRAYNHRKPLFLKKHWFIEKFILIKKKLKK